MDTKKKIVMRLLVALWTLICVQATLSSQNVEKIQFCSSEYGDASDSITLKFNILDEKGEHVKNVRISSLYDHLQIYEEGKEISSGEFLSLSGGIRIPKETTISVLIDQGIAPSGKEQIFEALENLVNSAPDSCIYLSFFDETSTRSRIATKSNYNQFRKAFDKGAEKKFLYGALYYKLLEFNEEEVGLHAEEYSFERVLSQRAKSYPEKTVMFVFVDGSEPANNEDPIQYNVLTDRVKDLSVKPTIYAFYYSSGSEINRDVEGVLKGITGSSKTMSFPKGNYVSTEDNNKIFQEVGKAIEKQKYDYAYKYKATLDSYRGETSFSASWDGDEIGERANFTIGTPENPWPIREETSTDLFMKFCIALLVVFLTVALFFAVMKILIPFIKSKVFAAKYYKKYQPEYGVQKRICSYCKQPLEPGQMIVDKCKHIMHVHCWKENDYRCAEFGQNCNTGVQEYVDWKHLLTKASFRDCHQVISGVFAGFLGWVVYELIGRGILGSLSASIADMFLTSEPQRSLLLQTCSSKVASFLAIGLLLGFSLSFVFRWNEEYRKKNFSIYMNILGLSLLSSLIGVLAFCFGGIILCMLVASINTSIIPWYCSIPAYILFSVCTSLSLTIKTSIPIKSAMLGGLCASVIGFLVLYFTEGFSTAYPWMNMLLDFIIYGGGVGASLVTVRLLAEKYFLVIQNGVKAGTRIPIHKWMNATGGGNKVTIGMTNDCEIQMNWEKSNKVAKEHAVLYIDHAKSLPIIKPMATNVIYNSRVELPVRKSAPLTNGDTFKIGDTIFLYEETD